MEIDQFNLSDATCVKTNDEYGFSIYWLKSNHNDKGILFTKGLSQHDQTKNANGIEFVYPCVELYFLMPKYWDIDASEYNWPIEWLDRIAQVPQKNTTWFGPGDTLPAGSATPPNKINKKFNQNYFILSDPIDGDNSLEDIGNDGVKFLAVLPIFREEFDYKNSHSAYKFFNKVKKGNYSECLDEYRPVLAKKKMFGLF